jgi:LmbE family N-acetylglucosaminyl deacetylase
MDGPLGVRLTRALDEATAIMVLSPHLDDAVLSCGALLSTLAKRSQVTVVTVFSAASDPPHTRAGRAFLAQCAAGNAADLYAARQREDAEVLTGMGVRHLHLDVPDALFRRRVAARPVAELGRTIPELVHRYPTYRFDIARGRVSRGDRRLLETLHERVARLVDAAGAELVFAPIGVGRHVDHLLTRSLGERLVDRAIFYSDFPYDQWASPDARYLAAHRLRRWTWENGLERKVPLIEGYRSQVGALFPTGDIPRLPETYFLPPA